MKPASPKCPCAVRYPVVQHGSNTNALTGEGSDCLFQRLPVGHELLQHALRLLATAFSLTKLSDLDIQRRRGGVCLF